ncbi:MAG TPA: hypothetical protein VLA58_09715, partial [Chitinophagaceae bacterium]|nr:hypothetical protein [Chitinophagaceae bacterium]
LALLIFFMPFILIGALVFFLFSFLFFRLFIARRMRKAYASRMKYTGVRRRDFRFDEENQVIYLSPKNFR